MLNMSVFMANDDRSLNAQVIEEALKRLNSKMAYAMMDSINLVVCGGAALIITKLVTRSTRDVDLIALANTKGSEVELLPPDTLPADLKQLVAEIAREFGIREDWLNFGPSPLLQFGLPEGLTTRLTKKSYGACLTVFFISRFDQVHFKIFAAMDAKEGTRHLSDLLDLEPAESEVKAAVSWLLGRKVSSQFKATLQQVLERIGYE
jgi:hypothetical protein